MNSSCSSDWSVGSAWSTVFKSSCLWKQFPWQVQQKTGLRVRNLEEIQPFRRSETTEMHQEQMVQQQKLQKHLALRHSMAAKRGVDGLPELPLARWEVLRTRRSFSVRWQGPASHAAAWGEELKKS